MDYFDQLKQLFEGPDEGLFKPKERQKAVTSKDRLMESFEEIVEFVRKNNKLPNKDADDLKEAGLGVRLASIRTDKHKIEFLRQDDELGLLEPDKAPKSLEDLYEKDNSGLFNGPDNEIFNLKTLPIKAKAKAESIARRTKVNDFHLYKQGFIDVQNGLKSGKYKLIRFTNSNQIKVGRYYVSLGQMVYVENIGNKKNIHGSKKARTHLIFENGTESEMYDRSLAVDLYEEGYCVVGSGELVEETSSKENVRGYIYVVKSLSGDPEVTTIKNLYKIGVTSDFVKNRIKNASNDPTYLMAPVKIVASYGLTGDFQPSKVEALIHRFFASAKVDIGIIDSTGSKYNPDEWYSVPFKSIIEMINRITDKSLVGCYYDTKTESIIESPNKL